MTEKFGALHVDGEDPAILMDTSTGPKKVAEVYLGPFFSGDGWPGPKEVEAAFPRALALAKMFAAAPVLVEALEAIGQTYALCVQCGPLTGVDEDGCCPTCGATAMGGWLEEFTEKARAALAKAGK